jgi:hypothetical protein
VTARLISYSGARYEGIMEVQLKMGGRRGTVADSFSCRRSSYLGQVDGLSDIYGNIAAF